MDIASALSTSAGTTVDPAAQAKARAEARRAERDALMAEIREKGFSAYVEDIQKEKIEELRKKLLEQMGLTEDDLGKLPAEQRAAVEKAIALEIQKQLEASHVVNDDVEDDAETLGNSQADASGKEAGGLVMQPGFAHLDTTLIQVLQQAQTERQAVEEQAKRAVTAG